MLSPRQIEIIEFGAVKARCLNYALHLYINCPCVSKSEYCFKIDKIVKMDKTSDKTIKFVKVI